MDLFCPYRASLSFSLFYIAQYKIVQSLCTNLNGTVLDLLDSFLVKLPRYFTEFIFITNKILVHSPYILYKV